MGFLGAVRPSAMRTVPLVVNAGWGRFTLERHCHCIHIILLTLTKANNEEKKSKKKMQTTRKEKKNDWAPMFVSSVFPSLTRYGKTICAVYPFVCQFRKMFSGEGRAQCSTGEEKKQCDVMRVWGSLQTKTSNREQCGVNTEANSAAFLFFVMLAYVRSTGTCL